MQNRIKMLNRSRLVNRHNSNYSSLRWNASNRFIKQVMEQVKKDLENNPNLKNAYDEMQKSKGAKNVETLYSRVSDHADNIKDNIKNTYKLASDGMNNIYQSAEENKSFQKIKNQCNHIGSASKLVFEVITTKSSTIVEWFSDEGSKARARNDKWKEEHKAQNQEGERGEAASTKQDVNEDDTIKANATAAEDVDSSLIVSDMNHESIWDRYGFRLSDTPFLKSFYSSQFVGKLLAETEVAAAIRIMKQLDKRFILSELIDEVEHVIAPHLVRCYLEGDEESLRRHCGEVAHATVRSTIRDRRIQKVTLDPSILHMSNIEFQGAKKTDSRDAPLFVFSFCCQQINCLRDAQGNVVAGGIDDIRRVIYAVAVTKRTTEESETPNLEYPWLVAELAIVGNQPVII
eukprot:GHVL01025306.1.p1 GENE.GHVL01025306.1~~GHVL01025306.1.p1  ORF type:complete len:424 (+),score=84.35 GHVL01025306.1:66-1274(+)